MKLLAATTLALLILAGLLDAATIRVPQQYANISSAIAVAGSGDEVVISAGNYAEYVILDGKAGVTVRGKGKVYIRPTTEGSAIQIINCGGVTVSNLGVRTCVSNGVVVSGSLNIRVEKCDIRDAQASGISVISSHNVLLERNVIRRTGNEAIKVDSYGIVVRKNKISELTGVHGITVRGHNNVIEQNVLSDLDYNGIIAVDTGVPLDLLIADNVIKGAYQAILMNAGADHVTVTGNRVVKPGLIGIRALSDSSAVVIFDNAVTKSQGSGLNLLMNDSLASGNKLVRCHNGIVFAGDNCDFHGNKMLKSGSIGFSFGTGSQWNLVCGNTATKSGQYDLEMYADPMDNDLVDNRFGTIAP